MPMGRQVTTEPGNSGTGSIQAPDRHDRSLAAYQLFASDKPISSFAEGSGSTKEPDVIFFNPLGFRREGHHYLQGRRQMMHTV